MAVVARLRWPSGLFTADRPDAVHDALQVVGPASVVDAHAAQSGLLTPGLQGR